MDDIGSGVKSFDELVPNLRKIFECVRASGLKLSPSKCEFGTEKIEFLGKYITPEGVQPEHKKIEQFLKKLKMPSTTKQVRRLTGFMQFWRDFIPNLGEKLLPFYKLLRSDEEPTLTGEHEKNLQILKNDLSKATEMTLRLAKPGLQYVLLCDASYHGAGFVLMIEDYCKDQKLKEKKTYAPVAFGNRLFNTGQLKFSIYYKEFLGLYFALEHFAHFIWGTEKPVIVLTDNRSLTSFFQAKTIPPSLWNCLDRLLSFNLVIAHIPGRANYAADFLSRMQTDPTQTLELKLNDKIPIKEIEVETTAKTPDVLVNSIESMEDIFDDLTPTNVNNDAIISQLKQQGISDDILKQIQSQTQSQPSQDDILGLIRFKAKISEINAIEMHDPADSLTDVLDRLEPLDLVQEQAKDDSIKEVLKWKKENKISDLTYASFALKKYAKQFDRLVIDNGILCRQFFDHTGKVMYLQVCLPKHLWKEVIYRLHNSPIAGHVGMVRTIQEFRKRFYFPGFNEYFMQTIKNCLTCIQQKSVSNNALRPFLQPVSSLQSFPGDMLQIDIVGPLPSVLYKYVLTGIDVFSKYLFAVPLTSISANRVAQELSSIFFQHSYIPHTIFSDLGSNFVSDLMHELSNLLEIRLKHASLKHAQTLGVVERAHGALKRILKLNTNEQWTNWFRYVPLATYIHNTSFYSSIGCTPSSIFHGREPTKPLDVRLSNKSIKTMDPKSDFVIELQDAMQEKFAANKSRLINSYHKYRKYYDQKAEANPLKLHEYCLVLNPKLTNQNDFASKSMQVWLPLYRVEKVLTNSNYLIRKVGTQFTQCVHRIRLRPYMPLETPIDLENIDPTQFVPDPVLGKFRQEPELFDNEFPKLFEHSFIDNSPELPQQPEDAQPVTTTLSVNIPRAIGPAPPPLPMPPPAPMPPAAPAPAPAPMALLPPAPPVAPPIQPAEPAVEENQNQNPQQDQEEQQFLDLRQPQEQEEPLAAIEEEHNPNQQEPEPEPPNPFAFFPEPDNQIHQEPSPNVIRRPQRSTRIPQPVAQSSQAVRPRTPRRVTFNPMTETATPLPGPHNPEVQYYRTIDGDFPIPFSNIPRAEKRDAIIKSARDSTQRIAFGKGPSRATKFDKKQSEAVGEQQNPPMTPPPNQPPKSPKQPSPLLNLVPGAKRRARLNAERENDRRQSRGDFNAIFGDELKLYFTKADIKQCPFSVVQSVSSEFPTSNLKDFNLPNASASDAVPHNLQEGSIVTIFDPSLNRFLYNLVTKTKDTHRASYSRLETCLKSLKQHVEDHNITKLALPQLECLENGLHWPQVCQLILKTFKNSNINLYIYV